MPICVDNAVRHPRVSRGKQTKWGCRKAGGLHIRHECSDSVPPRKRNKRLPTHAKIQSKFVCDSPAVLCEERGVWLMKSMMDASILTQRSGTALIEIRQSVPGEVTLRT